MINTPKTLKEAQKTRYRQWAGNSKGNAYNPNHCAYEVWDTGRSCLSSQCSNKNGKGINGLYCGIHAKKVI